MSAPNTGRNGVAILLNDNGLLFEKTTLMMVTLGAISHTIKLVHELSDGVKMVLLAYVIATVFNMSPSLFGTRKIPFSRRDFLVLAIPRVTMERV